MIYSFCKGFRYEYTFFCKIFLESSYLLQSKVYFPFFTMGDRLRIPSKS